MTILINTDNNFTVHENFNSDIKGKLEKELARFSDYITRVEVHMSDENGHKKGPEDKKCILEARMEGKQPIAVSANAGNHEQALQGAIVKLKSSLDSIIGKMKSH